MTVKTCNICLLRRISENFGVKICQFWPAYQTIMRSNWKRRYYKTNVTSRYAMFSCDRSFATSPPYASKKNAVESYPDGILRFLFKLIQKSFRQLLLSTRLFGRRICLNSRIISLHEWTAEKKHRKMAKNQFFSYPEGVHFRRFTFPK